MFGAIISETAGDRDLMTIEHLLDMATQELSRDRWRHVTLKVQGRDPNMLMVQYLENGWR